MSISGPGCPACDYRGRVPFDVAHPSMERPCGTCSPWSHGDDFPDAALRAKAAAVLSSMDPQLIRMVAWARRLLACAAEVDADRARLAATPCTPARGRCAW